VVLAPVAILPAESVRPAGKMPAAPTAESRRAGPDSLLLHRCVEFLSSSLPASFPGMDAWPRRLRHVA